jgi:N-acetyltransferase
MTRTINWQPNLAGEKIILRPLLQEDFETLYRAASDPLIWEQHPDSERYKRETFRVYFDSGIASKGALAVLEKTTGEVIGSSRFTGYLPAESVVEVGYTFLMRKYWGRQYNRELKKLMLDYAFEFVDTVHFYVGEKNLRSRAAMTKVGATLLPRMREHNVVFEMKKSTWQKLQS